MSERQGWRGGLRRLGWTLLGILIPGLPLIRFGRERLGLVLLVASLGLQLLLAAIFAAIDAPTFGIWLGILGGTAVVSLGVVLTSAIASWRCSAQIVAEPRWLQRWPSIVAIACISVLAGAILPRSSDFVRNFYVPAESMVPTIQVGDRIVARVASARLPPRGSIVIHRTPHGDWIKRVVALPGERFAMRRGQVVLNDLAIKLGDTGRRVMTLGGPGRVMTEQLPGEPTAHMIVDSGWSIGDEFGPITVPRGHVITLGDNRDNSADSRFGSAEMGTGPVRIADIIGTARFIYWSSDRLRIGRSLAIDTKGK